MPGYKGHLVGGALAFGVLFFLARLVVQPTWLTTAEWLGFALLGSLFPDIDIKSKGQKIFYWFVMVLFIVLIAQRRFQLLSYVSILAVIPMLARHRGLFHRLWFIIGMPTVAAALIVNCSPKYATPVFFDTLFFIGGAISHLWLDLGFSQMVKRR